MKNKHVVFAVIITYLVMSFMPQLGLMNLVGGMGGKGMKGGK